MMEIRIYQIDVPTSTNTKVEDDETQKNFCQNFDLIHLHILLFFSVLELKKEYLH